MPGGVNSPVRSFKSVGGSPVFIESARGAVLKDIDGNQYIDYVGSYGPLIVGHADDRVVAAITTAASRGSCFGAPTELETHLAELIISALPGMEMVRFVNSGTEATMSAIRLARAVTGREIVIKCIGCYHGHVDSLLVNAGSGALTHGTPSSPGIPLATSKTTVSVQYNDLAGVASAFEQLKDHIACLIIEPIAGNMGLVPPAEGYLRGLRQLCSKYGALLIFDEVMTGFRVAWGGAQTLFGIQPDLTCLGKIIGGGLPVGAYAGPRSIMNLVSPAGSVYQAGTLSGNPIAMSAGLTTLQILQEPGVYDELESRSLRLARGLMNAAQDSQIPVCVNRVGSMLCPFFVKRDGEKVLNNNDATNCDTQRFARFFHSMLANGINLPPSQFEAWFVSFAHTNELINRTIDAAAIAFKHCA